jgi:hypothetical protein
MRRWLAYVSSTVAATIVCSALFRPTPILCLHYPVWIANDPLVAPIQVTGIDGDRLSLADGRVLRVGSKEPSSLADGIRSCGFRVDVEEWSNGVTMVYAPVKLTRCGTPWTALIELPMFADPTPGYSRRPIAWQEATRARGKPGSD